MTEKERLEQLEIQKQLSQRGGPLQFATDTVIREKGMTPAGFTNKEWRSGSGGAKSLEDEITSGKYDKKIVPKVSEKKPDLGKFMAPDWKVKEDVNSVQTKEKPKDTEKKKAGGGFNFPWRLLSVAGEGLRGTKSPNEAWWNEQDDNARKEIMTRNERDHESILSKLARNAYGKITGEDAEPTATYSDIVKVLPFVKEIATDQRVQDKLKSEEADRARKEKALGIQEMRASRPTANFQEKIADAGTTLTAINEIRDLSAKSKIPENFVSKGWESFKNMTGMGGEDYKKFQDNVARIRLAIQSSLKGVPSDRDQKIIDSAMPVLESGSGNVKQAIEDMEGVIRRTTENSLREQKELGYNVAPFEKSYSQVKKTDVAPVMTGPKEGDKKTFSGPDGNRVNGIFKNGKWVVE